MNPSEAPGSLRLKTPALAPALPLLGAVFSFGVSYGALVDDGDAKAFVFFLIGGLALLVVARYAAWPRIEVTPEGLAYPRDFVTRKRIEVPWSRVHEASFRMVSGFYWPMLVLTLQDPEAPQAIPFPLVNKALRQEAMDLIQDHMARARP